MQLPRRKGDARLNQKIDPYLSATKYQELTRKLERLRASRPQLAEEVKRLAEMGDFSENAGYQLAKGRLRGLNQRIIDLENQLKVALIIKSDGANEKIQIGSRVLLEREGNKKEYTILGSTESQPESGIISHLSPLGMALMGRKAGEEVQVGLVGGKEAIYRVIRIESAYWHN